MNRFCVGVLILLLPFCAQAAKPVSGDSVNLSAILWHKALLDEYPLRIKGNDKHKLKRCIQRFEVSAMEYISSTTLSNETFLKSPDTLAMRPISLKKMKNLHDNESKERYYIRESIDDPETSLNFYVALLHIYFRNDCRQKDFADTCNEASDGFNLFKLHCYHLLAKSFPKNASFVFMVGRWHYNNAVDIINDIKSEDEEEKFKAAMKEIQLAFPWIKKASTLYSGFIPVYQQMVVEFGAPGN